MSGKKVRPRKHIPQRTCIACHEKRDKRQLTRLVRTPEGPVVVDPGGKRNGRGAYVCEQSSCWDKIITGNVLERALGTTISDTDRAAIAAHRPIMDGRS